MKQAAKTIQLQYEGYLNTPLLWKGLGPMDLEQLKLPKSANANALNIKIPENLRLGKLVERFVIAHLQQKSSVKILLENTQVQQHKITLGELDCIYKTKKKLVHLEIIYKYYLYDPNVGETALDHWIGPNKRDSLVKKLKKLKNKQLPLLFNQHTKVVLDLLNLKAKELNQKVCFKAQLFIPYKKTKVDFDVLNSDCVQGFYIPFAQIELLAACKFYIPTKLDWLIDAHTWVDWLSFDPFKAELSPIIEQKSAPLCWIKHPNGTLEKFFVVWW